MTKPSILFISKSSNWPKTDGKRQRTWFILEALLIEYEVDYLFIGNSEEYLEVQKSKQGVKDVFYLQQHTESKLPLFLLSKTKRKSLKICRNETNNFLQLIKSGKNYKFIFFRYIDSYFLFDFHDEDYLIADIDDVFSENQFSQIRMIKNWKKKIKRLLFFATKYYFIVRAYQRMNLLFVSKEEDKKRSFLGNALLLPNLPFASTPSVYTSTYQTPKAIGFIGKLSYLPNEEGLKWFLESVWPLLLKKIPDLHFFIAGAGAVSPKLNDVIQKAERLVFLGFIEDVKQFWQQISISVVPVFAGGGSNIKIAESLSFGRPVICNHFSAKGYNEAREEGILIIANSPKEWVDKISDIFASSEKLLIMSKKSQNFSSKAFDIGKWSMRFLNQLR